MPRRFDARKFGLDHLKSTAQKCRNRGRRGPEDEVDTLNFITPETKPEWIHRKEIAAICTDTWGCEVRPNETDDASQPWHWVVIPMIGITMGEIFYLKNLAGDCARDRVYEFFFCGPPLPITGAVGSPINPQAIN